MMASPELTDIAKRHNIVLLLQFGSTVTGKSHTRSDVDIAVLFDRPCVALEELGTLQAELQALYPERLVDLVVLNRADPLLLKQVTASCKLLYGSRRDLYELEIRAFKQYQDHRKFFEMERDYVDRAIGERTTS
jgi:predicted nucleotidyltransferase